MRRTQKVAVVSVGALVALAGCGSASRTGTSSLTTSVPAVTTPSTTAALSTTAPTTTVPATTVPAASVLSATERTDLTFIHEQERAGVDAYSVFASRYPSVPVFANLASSQRTQLTTVTAMMARYGLGDPSTGLAAGKYSDPTVQQLYDSTVAAGTSVDHALDAVEHFEQHNLASLQTARTHTTRSDLSTMYANLEQASNTHIDACYHAGIHH